MDELDDITALARDARDGDRAALTRFVRATQDEVWRLAAHLVDAAAADDLTQETYLRALRALPAFRGDASARTWLLSIARRTCADELRARVRRRRRDARLVPPAEPTTPDASGDVTTGALLASLDPDRRAAFVLTQILGLSYEHAAQVCDCPVGTIRSRVARARADLVDALSDQPDHDTRRPRRSAI